MPGFGIDERRHSPVTEFAAQSNGSTHRKGREERKAQPQKSLNSEESIRTGTRMQSMQSSAILVTMYEKAAASRLRTQMTRMTRIFTDTHNPCESIFTKFIFREQIENHEKHSH
jgi:hypothetical protein